MQPSLVQQESSPQAVPLEIMGNDDSTRSPQSVVHGYDTTQTTGKDPRVHVTESPADKQREHSTKPETIKSPPEGTPKKRSIAIDALMLLQAVGETPDEDEDANNQEVPLVIPVVDEEEPKQQQLAHLVPDYTPADSKASNQETTNKDAKLASSADSVLSDDSLSEGVKRSHDEMNQPSDTSNDDLDAEGNPRGTGCNVSTLIQAFHMDMDTSDSESRTDDSSNAKNKRQCRRKLPTRSKRSETAQTSEWHLYPSDIELNSVTNQRARAALETWYEKYRELIEFKKKHGHCNVPQKYFLNQSLGVWVNKQRMEKKFLDEGKKTSMTQQKLQALEKIGFLWAKRKGQHSWDEKYQQLKAFKRAHGDCQVPTRRYTENPALGRWVSTQRTHYKSYKEGKPSTMTEEKIAKLEALGFVWRVASS